MLPAIVLLALSSLLLWGNTLGLFHISGVAINALLVLYLALLVFSFSRHVFTTKKVDTELISAALCLYLLLGLFWGALLMLLEECIPGSFAGLGQIATFGELATRFYYFSFVTMTTLGYGDITLNSDWRILSGLEAIDGILLIGWTTAFLFAVLQRTWNRPGDNNKTPK